MRLLRGVSGRMLDCGCLVGIYETYGGQVVATIDARGPRCGEASHALHHEVSLEDRQRLGDVQPAGAAGTRHS